MKAQDLKNSVLKLAIQGKLVEQNPNDEPASVLLEKIKAEKEKLIKDKKIKREKPLPEISEKEKSFEIPDSWQWVRLGELSDIYSGNSINKIIKEKKYMGIKEGYPYIATKDVDSNIKIIDYNNGVRIPYDEEKFKIAKSKSILICAEGGSAGKKIGLLNKDVCFGNKLINFNGFINEINKYIYYLFQSVEFYQQFVADMTGIIGGISINKFKSLPIAVPPLEEQKRIVAKIEEVLEKIEEYDKAEKELSKLKKSFPQDMKKSILQYAIQGKLVEQNPEDEPAYVLLEKIKAEKEKLIREKKIKGEKQLPEISEGEKYFEIPQNWKWVRLNDICSYIQRGKSPKYSEVKEIPVIAQKCVQWSGVDLSKAKFIEPETIKKYSDERILKQGDLLWNSTGLGTLGRINMFVENEKYKTIVADSHVTVIRAFKELVDYKYLFYWFSGPIVQGEVESKSTGSTKQMELGTTTIKEYLVPLPPLEEQKRIVEKIEKLLNYVDKLQNRIDNQNLINKIVKAKSIELSESKELINN